MTMDSPIACSLNASDLRARLDEIGALGRDALLSTDTDGTMRFRANGTTRERLEAIIAAEASCCSFLRFKLTDEGDTLSTHDHSTGGRRAGRARPHGGVRPPGRGGLNGRRRPTGRTGSLFGIAGVIMALCCLAGPAVLGAVAGTAIGSWVGIVARVAVALAAAALLRYRRTNNTGC